MKGIGNESKRMDGIACDPRVSQEAASQRLELSLLPTISSSKKKAVSMSSRMMILLDLESPIAAALRRARGAKPAQNQRRAKSLQGLRRRDKSSSGLTRREKNEQR